MRYLKNSVNAEFSKFGQETRLVSISFQKRQRIKRFTEIPGVTGKPLQSKDGSFGPHRVSCNACAFAGTRGIRRT